MPVRVSSASGPGLSHFEHGTHGTYGTVETATHQKTHAQIPAAWASNAGSAHAGRPGRRRRTHQPRGSVTVPLSTILQGTTRAARCSRPALMGLVAPGAAEVRSLLLTTGGPGRRPGRLLRIRVGIQVKSGQV